MKFGGFGRMNDYEDIREAGFDYAELDIPEIEALTRDEFEDFVKHVKEIDFPILTGARALPIADPWFFTEKFSLNEYAAYLENACSRARILGIKKIIIGNGKARWLVDESSREKENRFIEFMRMFADIALKNNLEVILEPLGPKYSNYINTIPEAVDVIKKIGRSNVYTMADLRHLVWSKETLEDIPMYIEYIHHIHVDYPLSYPERPFPKKTDDYDYTSFLKELKKSGYQETVTVEADIPDDWNTSYQGAFEVLREVL